MIKKGFFYMSYALLHAYDMSKISLFAIHSPLKKHIADRQKWAGKDRPLRAHPPLRTVLATFTAHGSNKSLATETDFANGFPRPLFFASDTA